MANPIINFVKKTYKILIVLSAAVIFFLGYNTYLVDRSLANLRVALDKVSDAKTLGDASKLVSVLDYSLVAEVSSQKLQVSSISKIELAKDILSRPQDLSQLEDVKFVLNEVIKEKEKERAGILVVLDKVTKAFTPAITKISKAKLKDQASYIKERISIIKDKYELQTAYYELANIYTRLSDFDAAEDALRKTVALNPESRLAKKCRFNLAWNQKRQGNFEEAIKEFADLSQTAAEENLSVFSKYQMADAYRQKGGYAKAATLYQEVAKESQDKDLIQFSKFRAGYTYLYDLKDHSKAEEIFDRLKGEFKGSGIAAHIEKATIPNIVNQYRKTGFGLLKEGYELSASNKHKEAADKYQEALKHFERVLEVVSEDSIAYIGKALGFLWLGNPDKALEFARKSVKLKPEEELASVNLGYIYIKMGLVDGAIEEYKRFIKITPFTATGYYNLGCVYAIQHKLEEAVAAFHQATKINPKFALAFNNEGWCLWQLQRYAEAVGAFQKAVEVKPDFLDALVNLSMVFKALGRYEDARNKLETVLEISPLYTDAQNLLAEINRIIQESKI